MKRNYCLLYVLLVLLTTFASCDSEEDRNTLSVDQGEVNFGPDGGTSSILLETNAKKWSISNPISDWLTLSIVEGTTTAERIELTVSSRTLEARTGVLVISAGNAEPVEVTVSQPSSEHLYIVTADVSNISFTDLGGSKQLKITTDASHWTAAADNADWLHFSKTSGEKGMSVITITADENTGSSVRTGTISITADEAATLQIPVTQNKPLYPSYNTSPIAPDADGMASDAGQIAANFKLGWNLGNTLEAIGGETAWGNPQATQALIDKVKASGFTAVRLPCSWNQYANQTTAKIQDAWLERVKQVVQYCINDGLYVILNIHWDGGWLENNITTQAKSSVNAKQKAFWEQIATKMRDFDEHLMFASANEPNSNDATSMGVLLSYHQTFVDAVRSTGGRNTYRTLVVQGPSTNVDHTNNLMNTLPTDPTLNRMMVEVHYYEPWQFTALSQDESWGNMFYYWGQNNHSTIEPSRNATWGEEDFVVGQFPKMKTKFVDKGVPVILGEYGAYRRTTPLDMDKHQASVDRWITFVTQQAIANGCEPFWWDTGGLISRSNYTVSDQRTLNALIQGAQ